MIYLCSQASKSKPYNALHSNAPKSKTIRCVAQQCIKKSKTIQCLHSTINLSPIPNNELYSNAPKTKAISWTPQECAQNNSVHSAATQPSPKPYHKSTQQCTSVQHFETGCTAMQRSPKAHRYLAMYPSPKSKVQNHAMSSTVMNQRPKSYKDLYSDVPKSKTILMHVNTMQCAPQQ